MLSRAPRFQSPHNPDECPATILWVVFAPWTRGPHLAAGRIFKLRGHNAYHGRRLVVERQLLSNQVRVTAEVLLPPVVAQNHNRTGALLIFLRQEGTAQERRGAQGLEEAWRDNPGADRFGFSVTDQEMAPRFGHAELVEGLALLAPIEKISGRSLFALDAAFGGALPDGDNAVILPVRQRTQQNAVHHAEDGRVGGDAERQH